jgi:PIN like domain
MPDMPKRIARGKKAERRNETTTPSLRPPLPPLCYPIGKTCEDPSDFIQRAAKVISDPRTSIYVDTSFLTWLTKAGPESRQQFVEWAKTIGPRIHVPVWSYHEYYRHHGHNTLRADIRIDGEKLKAAATNFAASARTIADNPLNPNSSTNRYGDELQAMLDKVADVLATAKKWDYDTAATHISEWMSERLCRSRVVFDLMNSLGDLGATRYTQDVPPGFLDRVKLDTDKKGSNRFGDLVMWEEVLAHVVAGNANAVVILTRDSKPDWFAPAASPEAEGNLRALRGGKKWDPVPAPHPTLVIELQERTSATELVLLDNLYFAAVLHQLGDKGSARLIAYGLGVASTTYAEVVAQAELAKAAPPKRPTGEPLSRGKARSILGALNPFHPSVDPSAPLDAALKALKDAPPTGLQFVTAFDHRSLANLTLGEAAELARTACDMALTDRGQVAQSMSNKLLLLIAASKADVAGAVLAGMLSSAYFEEAGATRAVPTSSVLQELFGVLNDPVYVPMLDNFNENLSRAGSFALFMPRPGTEKLPVLIKNDSSQQQLPPVLCEIAFDEKTLTCTTGRAVENNLRRLIDGKDQVPVSELLALVANTYGLPLARLEPVGAITTDERSIPDTLGLVSPMDLQTSATTLEEAPAVAAHGDEDDANAPNYDSVEEQAERDEEES